MSTKTIERDIRSLNRRRLKAEVEKLELKLKRDSQKPGRPLTYDVFVSEKKLTPDHVKVGPLFLRCSVKRKNSRALPGEFFFNDITLPLD
jgi:hypothetical protein